MLRYGLSSAQQYESDVRIGLPSCHTLPNLTSKSVLASSKNSLAFQCVYNTFINLLTRPTTTVLAQFIPSLHTRSCFLICSLFVKLITPSGCIQQPARQTKPGTIKNQCCLQVSNQCERVLAFRQQAASCHLKHNILSTRLEQTHKISSTVHLPRNSLDPSAIVMTSYETELFSTHSGLSEDRNCRSSPLTKAPFTPLSRSSAPLFETKYSTQPKSKPRLNYLKQLKHY